MSSSIGETCSHLTAVTLSPKKLPDPETLEAEERGGQSGSVQIFVNNSAAQIIEVCHDKEGKDSRKSIICQQCNSNLCFLMQQNKSCIWRTTNTPPPALHDSGHEGTWFVGFNYCGAKTKSATKAPEHLAVLLNSGFSFQSIASGKNHNDSVWHCAHTYKH